MKTLVFIFMTAVLSFGFVSQDTERPNDQKNIITALAASEEAGRLEVDFVPRVIMCGEHQTYRCENAEGFCSVGGQVPCSEFEEMISPY